MRLKALFVVAALTALGCSAMSSLRGDAGTQFPLRVSTEVPAAVGTVTVKTVSENEQHITLQVEHLAPVEKAVPGAQAYVVWLHPMAGGGQPMNMGTLTVGEDRRAQFETTTTFRNFSIFVTPETNPRATQPSHPEVLTAQVQPKTPY
jgi:hypothetical protein